MYSEQLCLGPVGSSVLQFPLSSSLQQVIPLTCSVSVTARLQAVLSSTVTVLYVWYPSRHQGDNHSDASLSLSLSEALTGTWLSLKDSRHLTQSEGLTGT